MSNHDNNDDDWDYKDEDFQIASNLKVNTLEDTESNDENLLELIIKLKKKIDFLEGYYDEKIDDILSDVTELKEKNERFEEKFGELDESIEDVKDSIEEVKEEIDGVEFEDDPD